MESVLLDIPSMGASFRWGYIDGGVGGEGAPGGRLVCINGTGDLPLFEYTIDPSQCLPGPLLAPTPELRNIEPPPGDMPPPPIPEPSQWVLVALGLLGVLGWKARA